jgi:carboxyl-terminal processing protease
MFSLTALLVIVSAVNQTTGTPLPRLAVLAKTPPAQTAPKTQTKYPEKITQLEQIYTLIKRRYVYPDTLYPEAAPEGQLVRTLNRDQLWEKGNWDEVRAFALKSIQNAKNSQAADAALEDMVAWLRDGHSTYLDAARVEQVQTRLGRSLVCLPAPSVQTFLQTSLQTSQTSILGSTRTLQTRLEGKVGIITLPDIIGFDRTFGMQAALEELRKRGAKAFVIDLRGNPGGQLVDMVGLAGLFQTGLLWKLHLRGMLIPFPIPAVGSAKFTEPLAMVVDNQVNSAAEGLSGGLQAVGRAKIFGETSAGNVEAVYPYCLSRGAIVFIASGQLSPWKGATWEGVGVIPDGQGGLPEAIKWAATQIKPS